MGLTIELVPRTCWYSNVRSQVSRETWDIIRKKCYQHAHHQCEICGETGLAQGYKHKVECHEIWHYDDKRGIQLLQGFISLCPLCHEVKHAGLTISRKGWEGILARLMRINFWDRNTATNHVLKEFERWEHRSLYRWRLDISYLDHYIGSCQQSRAPSADPSLPGTAPAGKNN